MSVRSLRIATASPEVLAASAMSTAASSLKKTSHGLAPEGRGTSSLVRSSSESGPVAEPVEAQCGPLAESAIEDLGVGLPER
jgi:hypothetical protein